MSTDERTFRWVLSSEADSFTPEFGVRAGQHFAIETAVLAAGTPTGTFALQRRAADGSWVAYDTGDATFTDPAAGAAAGTLDMLYPVPGGYRVAYAYDSGDGDAEGITVIVRVGHA